MLTPYENRLLREKFAQNTSALAEAVQRVNSGIPLAYVLGEWGFFAMMFDVEEGILIPRSDSEHLVERTLFHIGGKRETILVDLCCGSGCIGLAVLNNSKINRGYFVDISQKALHIAKKNARKYLLQGRAEFIHADVLDENFYKFLADKITAENFKILPTKQSNGEIPSQSPTKMEYSDIIICANPPYIRSDVISTLTQQVQSEGALALDGGVDGLNFYRAILSGVSAYLPCATIIFEIGYDQAESVTNLCHEYGYSSTLIKDYGGNDRVISAQNI